MLNTLIITRHQGMVEWLKQHGVVGKVLSQATAGDVVGKDIVGVLPFHLAVLAETVTVVDMPGLKLEQRGLDLSPEDMDEAGAMMTKYKVTRLD